MRRLIAGAAAGAVGTAVLNIITYADMAWRGRPASEMPARLVKILAARSGLATLTADDEAAANRRAALGALLGYANGIGLGALYGAIRPALGERVSPLVGGLAAGAAAMALSDVPASAAGATDPATWKPADWLADIVPHAFYGLAIALTFEALNDRRT